MADSEREPGITFNGRTIPVYLGLIGLATAIYTGVTTLNAYGFQVEKLQTEQNTLGVAVTELKASVLGLNESITNLTIVLNRVEDRYKTLEDRIDKLDSRNKR